MGPHITLTPLGCHIMNLKQCIIPWWTEGALVKINDHQNKDRLCNARVQLELQLKMFQSTKHLVTHNISS